jgi:hypothetical protein
MMPESELQVHEIWGAGWIFSGETIGDAPPWEVSNAGPNSSIKRTHGRKFCGR